VLIPDADASSGESAMIVAPIYDMALGVIIFSLIFAAILGLLKKKRAL
jgi:hypothetical protein